MRVKVDTVDREYFATEIEPLIDGTQIEYLGEANQQQKSIILGGAVATLFPITWREPFGLVMVESLISGTPVIALNMGSVPEVLVDGLTGFICQTVEECIEAVDKISQIDRRTCHDYVLENFTAKRMAEGYEAVYQKLMGDRHAMNGYVHTLSAL